MESAAVLLGALLPLDDALVPVPSQHPLYPRTRQNPTLPHHVCSQLRRARSKILTERRLVMIGMLIFTFDALCHALSPRLLAWGWLATVVIFPEVMARRTLGTAGCETVWVGLPISALAKPLLMGFAVSTHVKKKHRGTLKTTKLQRRKDDGAHIASSSSCAL